MAKFDGVLERFFVTVPPEDAAGHRGQIRYITEGALLTIACFFEGLGPVQLDYALRRTMDRIVQNAAKFVAGPWAEQVPSSVAAPTVLCRTALRQISSLQGGGGLAQGGGGGGMPAPKDHQPPTATNHRLPTANRRKPSPTANRHQPPTATNH